MGHSLGVDGQYNVERPLSPEKVDELRTSYSKCEPYLSAGSKRPESEGAEEVVRALLIARGMPEDEADKLDFTGKSRKELVEMFRRLGASQAKRLERAVSVDQVPSLLDAGWEFVAPLNGSMAVLRSP
jgi:hypothetical protein